MALNRHLIGMQGDRVIVMFPIAGYLSPQQAAEAAAWLACIAEIADPSIDFDAILKSARST